MIDSSQSQSGFSAVELLITLFIAAAFIATGYQLYAVVINDGGKARMRANASNIAYESLRRYSGQATVPCSSVTPAPVPTVPPDSNLPNASIGVTISCPYGTSSATSKIEVILSYGSPQEEIVHASYVSR